MHRFASYAAAALALFFASPLAAQELDSFAGMRFRFDAPGARSTAMGGASEALTDVFTAATNPASLARQRNRALAVEVRENSSSVDYLTGGTVGSFTTASMENSARGVRSAIVVLPAASATWAVYYDEPLNIVADATRVPLSTGHIIIGLRGNELVPDSECQPGPNAPADCAIGFFNTPAIYPIRSEVRLRRYGAAGAWSRGRFAFGGGVQYAQLHQESGPNTILGQRTSGGRFTFNAGTQIDVTSRLHLGGSYRSGAEYDTDRWIAPGNSGINAETYRTPSSYAAGLAFDVTPRLTVTADAVRVNYSDMTREISAEFQSAPMGWTSHSMPDVTELRAGAEYRLATRVPVALRAGWWSDPAHRLRATGHGVHYAALSNLLLLDADENHVTAGIGVGDRVRVDAAIDRSERTTRASVALATTF